VASNLNNLGNLYNNQKKYEEALVNFNKALKIYKRFNVKPKIAGTLLNTGGLAFSLNDYALAESYFRQASALFLALDDIKNYSSTQARVLNCLYKQQKEKEAHLILDSLNSLYPQIEHANAQINLYNAKYSYYAHFKKYDSAYFYHKKYIKLKDSLSAEESKKEALKLERRYNFVRKQAEIEQLEADKAFQKKEIEQANQVLYGATFTALILLVAVIVSLRALRQKRLANIKALKQKEETEKQAQKLHKANSKLELLNERQHVFANIGREITRALSLPQLNEILYPHINKLMDASAFGIGLLDKENELLRFEGFIEKEEVSTYPKIFVTSF
jgi:tetratricopeptide (TPR) repeat protein